jgi:ribosomal protein S18 acetylase RimI-like enzyme
MPISAQSGILRRSAGGGGRRSGPRADIVRKLTEQPELFLVAEAGEIRETAGIAATAMVGFDGHRGWVHYLAVDPSRQRQGLGHAIMVEAERLLVERGCPKLNLQVRSDNLTVLGFYRGLGYGEDQVLSLGKRLILDEG